MSSTVAHSTVAEPHPGWQARLEGARWFAGKGLGGRITSVRPLPWLTPDGVLPAVRPELAEVGYGGRTETYHLLAGYLPAGTAEPAALVGTAELDERAVDLVDAPASPLAMTALLDALAAGGPAVRWLPGSDRHPAGEPRLFTGEQSNSTVVVGEQLVKVFRRLEPGRNLDVEVLEALNGSGLTPRLHAVVADGGFDLAMLYQRLTGVSDGWVVATAACAAGTDFTAELQDLGAALRGVHEALADAFGTSGADGDTLAGTMLERLRVAAADVPALAAHAVSLTGVLQAPSGRQLVTQRVHGDFHLGQALLSAEGWHIIDFEGEPLKSLAERRAPDTVWRDVAGLLRSIDYARSAHAEPSGEQARRWAAAGREAFLAGYGSLPPGAAALLTAYEADKAVYEVVYETRNRPEWAHIPLAAVQDVAERAASSLPAHNQMRS
ncbi:MAG TPA: phosphotransferase [Propionicimonas sp.]|jgi:maltokinase|nr:phosphotransferase [Propionicimonas sp.]